MIEKVRTISYDQRAKFFWVLVGASFVSLFTYIYAIHSTARNIALRQDLERQSTEVSANLNALEFSYIDLKNDITLELAHNYGFKEAKTPIYISRTSKTLSFNTIER